MIGSSQNIANTIITKVSTMDNDDQTETACELFEQYAALLNREFHDPVEAEKNGRQCIALAAQLIKIGFVILAHVPQHMETITLSNDMTQTILTFTYELILIPNQIPVQEPIAYANAVARVFGPVTPQVHRDHTHPMISPKDEAWLHSILDNLVIDKSDKDSPTEERN